MRKGEEKGRKRGGEGEENGGGERGGGGRGERGGGRVALACGPSASVGSFRGRLRRCCHISIRTATAPQSA
eukprot:802012-Rhodomonas_salina.3